MLQADTEVVGIAEFEAMPSRKQPEKRSPKTLFSIKGFQEWYDWLVAYSESLGMTVTGAIDYALREQAKRDKFEQPMPKRFGSR